MACEMVSISGSMSEKFDRLLLGGAVRSALNHLAMCCDPYVLQVGASSVPSLEYRGNKTFQDYL